MFSSSSHPFFFFFVPNHAPIMLLIIFVPNVIPHWRRSLHSRQWSVKLKMCILLWAIFFLISSAIETWNSVHENENYELKPSRKYTIFFFLEQILNRKLCEQDIVWNTTLEIKPPQRFREKNVEILEYFDNLYPWRWCLLSAGSLRDEEA